MTSNITAFETELVMIVPDAKDMVTVRVRSDVGSGMTLTIPPGSPMWKLHDQIVNGLICEVTFTYKPAEAAQ